MKVLTTSAQISQELLQLIEECSSCQVAVAWASTGFEAFDLLVKHGTKIARMVVGTHFYQTNPQFIESFLNHPKVRFVMKADGVFHPKTYLFLKAPGEWECLIGSPNFTPGGLVSNDEMAVLITHRDAGAQKALDNVTARLDTYWGKSSPISEAGLNVYREAWKRKQPVVNSLRGRFGDPHKEDADDRGKNPLDVKVLQLTWAEYFEMVKAEKDYGPHDHSMEGRLRVIRATKKLFSEHEKFSQIDPTGRPNIPVSYSWPLNNGGVRLPWLGRVVPGDPRRLASRLSWCDQNQTALCDQNRNNVGDLLSASVRLILCWLLQRRLCGDAT